MVGRPVTAGVGILLHVGRQFTGCLVDSQGCAGRFTLDDDDDQTEGGGELIGGY
jgi:hypothetical protein